MKILLLSIFCSIVITSCRSVKPLPQNNEDENLQKIEQLEKTDEYVPWWLKENGQNN